MSSVAGLQSSEPQGLNVDNARTIASVVGGSGVALLALFLAPVLVGEYIAQLGVSEASAGLILSMELTGFTVGSAALFLFSRTSWRKLVFVALMIMIAANLALLLVTNLPLFVLCRFTAGLGSGMVMTMTIQVIGLMRDPDRVYGLWTVGQLALGALGMVLFPTVIAIGGVNTVFLIWALLAATLLLSVRFYPRGRNTVPVPGAHGESRGHARVGLLALVGLFIYYSGQAGVWVYMERIGISWEIEPAVIAQLLFVSLLAAIAGAMVAIVIGDKFGRAIPLSVSMTISAFSITLLMSLEGVMLFVVAACLFNFGWYLFLPFISAIISTTDNDGRLLTGLAVTFPASLAAGPAIAALLIGHGESLLPCLIYGAASVPLGLALILPATGAANKFKESLL